MNNKISYIDNFNVWLEDFSFFQPVKVRFSETDMLGHLNNCVPFIYFEEARLEFLTGLGFMEKWMNSNSEVMPVAANMQCDYVEQVFFDEKINVFVKVHSIGTSSVDIHYLGKKENGNPCLTGRGTLVQISKLTGKGVPWSDQEKSLLQRSPY